MLRSVNEIRARIEDICRRYGASDEETKIFADVLVEAELRGRPTHGLNRVKGICRLIQSRTPGQPEIVEERGPLVRIDGNDQSGYIVARFMTDHAVETARREGHALVGVRNTRHCGMLGYYAASVAQNNLIALCFADCAPMVAPWGAAEPVLGTNPVAAAFPARPYPILIDMGTCAVTYGALDRARRTGRKLPEKCALDADGHFTTDPEEVRTVLPFGEHRGSALGLLVQLLSGVVVGAAAIPNTHTDYGLFMLAMRPDLFAPPEHYESGVKELIGRIKSARPICAGVEILIPGERAFREREQRLNEGIEVSDAQWAELEALALRREG